MEKWSMLACLGNTIRCYTDTLEKETKEWFLERYKTLIELQEL